MNASQLRRVRGALFAVSTDLAQKVSALSSIRRRFSVHWSKRWEHAHSRALHSLPQLSRCPHDLYQLLARTEATTEKRFAIVERDRRAVAVVALRRHRMHWELITDNVVPWCLFPAMPGEHANVLSLLNLPLQTTQHEDPAFLLPRQVDAYTIYRARLDSAYERYWKNMGHLNTVRQARNKTKSLCVRIDEAGDIERVTSAWMNTWQTDPYEEVASGRDRIAAGRVLARSQQYHSLTLVDGDMMVAGSTFYVHDASIVLQAVWRHPAYERKSVGTRLLDATFRWAKESGYAHLDLGGGHAYKARWAPPDGSRFTAHWQPGAMVLLGRARTGAAAVSERMKAAISSLRPPPRRPPH